MDSNNRGENTPNTNLPPQNNGKISVSNNILKPSQNFTKQNFGNPPQNNQGNMIKSALPSSNNNNNRPNSNNNTNNNNRNNNNNNNKPSNPYQMKLKYAYDLYINGQKDYRAYSLELALDKFEKAQNIVNECYPHVKDDKNLKETTDDFVRRLNTIIKTTEYQIKNKYEYKTSAGFANVDYEKQIKEDVARVLREEEESKKRKQMMYNQYQNNANANNYNNNYNNNNYKPNNVGKAPQSAPKKDEKSVVSNELKDKIMTEIVENKPDVKFSDVVGLKEAKQILKEIIIIPNLRPDLFTGLRSPPRGLLLFGPPGTGKTMIAKAVATECKCTFFNISASSLTSKYLGESEKLVRALFEMAFEKQPSVVFIDEIESILSKRKEDENEAMKRLKTEFLIQFDGVGSTEEARVLIIGATNRPFDLDPAIIRRLPKRVYVGPFDEDDKKGFIKTIITQNECTITDEEYAKIAKMCNNYSNSDLKELCREAAYEPMRQLNAKELKKVDKLRPICYDDFVKAVRKVRGTLTKDILKQLEVWNQEFGALGN